MSTPDTDHSLSFPVFYDRSGKRLRRVVLAVIALLCVVVGVVAWLIPAALAPTWVTKSDPGFARRTLAGQTEAPAIGEGVMTRLVRVEREHSAADPPPADPPPADPRSADPMSADLGSDDPPAEAPADDPPDQPPTPPWKLVDAVTGEYIRDATEWEREEIGDATYVIDRFSAVPDHTLMLTFDDGPDPAWTSQILDILSREHVPATFFVMGERVVKNPDVLRRIVREGHMVGNHTMTHPNLDTQNDMNRQLEFVATDRIIRATANYATPLFRIPTGDPDLHPITQLQSQQLGYIQVDYDLDTNDWRYGGHQVPVPSLDGGGHVVLMHDGGGDRRGTVEMLKKLIADAKAQGYTFTTVAPLLSPNFLPQKGIKPTLTDRATLLIDQTAHIAPRRVLPVVIGFSLGGMLILTTCYLLLSSLNECRQRRRVWPDTPDDEWPCVSVVLAAYNEEKVIRRTLDALRDSDYPATKFEVVAVNDGSTDQTLAVLQGYDWPQLQVVHQRNSGKSSAINNGVNHARPESTVIITMDADTLFRPSTIRMLARHFIGGVHRRKKVGVVCGHVKVGNRRNILTAWQSLEYLNGICIIRMAEMMVGAIGVVPGACSAWRRAAVERIGGFSENTLAEDADAAMTLQRLRYAVIHENAALCDTEAPETIKPLLKQRKRWMFGNFQVMWKNRGMMFRPRYGLLGMVTMPYAVIQLLLNLMFLPVLIVMGVLSLAQGAWQPVVAGAVVILAMHTVIAITAVTIARERLWHLLVIPIYRPIYEVMRVYLLYACAYRIIKGAEFSWDKLERMNSVVAAG